MVKADGEDKKSLSLPRTGRDDTLQMSLICERHAAATKGHIERVTPVELLYDDTGKCYNPESRISLRWWRTDSPRSDPETFYIVPDCGGYDAIFGKGCRALSGQGHSAYPLQNDVQTAGTVFISIADYLPRSDILLRIQRTATAGRPTAS
jgi:hypothetical protein